MLKSHLKSPNWILLLGQLLAQLSDRMLSIGLIWIISKNFGDQAVTWYLVVGGLPHLIFFSWSSKLIRLFGALKIVMQADWMRAFIYLCAGFLVANIDNQKDLYEIMALIFATNAMAAFFNPAIFSLPIELETESEKVQKLTARLSAITSITAVLGPLAGILCFQALGLHGLFLLAAGFYFISGFCAWTLRSNISASQDLAQPSAAQYRFLGIPALIVSMLIVFLLMNLLTSPIQILMPAMARSNFSGSFNSLATMEVGLGSGISVGGIILSFIAIKTKTLLYTWLFLVGVALSFFFFQFSSNLWMAAMLLCILGLFVGLANILILNIFQSYPDAHQVPQVMSFVNLIGSAAVPLSLILAGFLQTKISIHQIGVFGSIALIIICTSSWFPFRRWGKELF